MWSLNDILPAEQVQDGFAVFEDEHFVYLKKYDEVCLTFSSPGVTRESIREAIESIRN